MRIKSAASARTWCDAKEVLGESSLIDEVIRQLLASDELLILCGLGTSLSIETPGVRHAPPSMEGLWQGVKAKVPAQFAKVREIVHFPDDSTNIEDLLSRCQSYLDVDDDPDMRQFVEEAEAEIARLCRFVGPDSDLPVHASFLGKLCRRAPGQARTKIFTTNYDLAFEHAASGTGMVVIDGFTFTEPRTFDPNIFEYDLVRRTDPPEYVPSVFHLYKLHGSVDWEQQGGQTRRNPDASQPLLIYPRASKFQYSYRPPFFDMMAALQAALRKPNVGILVIGFGFNDLHIVQPFMAAVRTNPTLTSVVVAPEIEGPSSDAVNYINALIDQGDGRHALVAGTFADFVQQIPQLHIETQTELHERRVRQAAMQ